MFRPAERRAELSGVPLISGLGGRLPKSDLPFAGRNGAFGPLNSFVRPPEGNAGLISIATS